MHPGSTTGPYGKWVLILPSILLSAALMQPRAVTAIEDEERLPSCELESLINQLLKPIPDYQLHANALRNQLKNILRERQVDVDTGEEKQLEGYDYMDEDKRSLAALAGQGLLHQSQNSAKRSLATLAKNGQLPMSDSDDYAEESAGELMENKRNIGSLARDNVMLNYGKRNVGTLARDFQLPLPNGKRNLATMARLGMLQSAPGLSTSSHREPPKRNVAAVARYNSQHQTSISNGPPDKRNLGALKGSPVHGNQKREDEEVLPLGVGDYAEPSELSSQSYWWYPSYAGYADLDWNDYRRARAEKRFLDTSKDPELFGVENGLKFDALTPPEYKDAFDALQPRLQKRHIGAVYRSGFLPTYRYLRSPTGSSSGRFSRSGRGRQFVEYYPQQELLRQPLGAVCKRCFLPNRPMINWNSAGIRGRLRLPKYFDAQIEHSISTNLLPEARGYRYTPFNSWGTRTPPRITALHQREIRRSNEPVDSYKY